ncbi:MAG: hypothetical protein WD040_05745, partial [Anaerolineales bacterium]
MTKKTAIYNSTGRLKRVLLGKPTHYEIMPLNDPARDLHDVGTKLDSRAGMAQHKEFESVFEELGVGISWVEIDSRLHWQTATRDFGVNTPQGVLLGRFR